MWNVASATDVSTILPQSPPHDTIWSSSPSHPEMAGAAGDISGLSPTPLTPYPLGRPTASTMEQFTIRAPNPAPRLTTQSLNAPSIASYRYLNLPRASLESQFSTAAGAPHEAAAGSDHALLSPLAVAVPNGGHEVDFRPALAWACSVCPSSPITFEVSLNHETPNAPSGVGDSVLHQSTSVMRREKHHNRITDRHQRPTVFPPYTIPPPNYIGAPVSCSRAGPPIETPPRTEAAGNLASTTPGLRLTLDTYEWLFSVMYPKRRPDKSKPTPSGQCRLCDSTCKRAGILQQHVTILHRQRLARKHLAGKPYDLQLALAFVVAQVLCGVANAHTDAVQESQAFLAMLKGNPEGLNPLLPDVFPSLLLKLDEFSRLESWVGVQCQFCGMWATRPVALEQHAAICTRTGQEAKPLRLTASGLAARPN